MYNFQILPDQYSVDVYDLVQEIEKWRSSLLNDDIEDEYIMATLDSVLDITYDLMKEC